MTFHGIFWQPKAIRMNITAERITTGQILTATVSLVLELMYTLISRETSWPAGSTKLLMVDRHITVTGEGLHLFNSGIKVLPRAIL